MNKSELATFAGGCFWCTEAIFQRLKGVSKVRSGYSGGEIKNPNYEEVSGGDTGHAESIQIEFDPATITFEKLLEVFFKTHDPTTMNRQGADTGTQYRSAIFYHNEKQHSLALKAIEKIEKEKIYDNPVVTQVVPFESFFKAEDYHNNYYNKNKFVPYCRLVINPKLKKLENLFSDLIQ